MSSPERLQPLSDFAGDLLAGLGAGQKVIPPKYFYDERGSELFEQICGLPEYYPARVETELLRAHAGEIAERAGKVDGVVEFGAGALRKVEILLDALAPRLYLPVDISGPFLRQRAAMLRRDRPALTVRPVVADFTRSIALPPAGRLAGFFPGSTIGNLEPADAVRFLRRTRALLRDGSLLIGVDLVKKPAVLNAAYNDVEGITAAFNKNVLIRANRELGADFDPTGFEHYAFYNAPRRRIEMHLVSERAQVAHLAGFDVVFEQGETVHTENSYKYTADGFVSLALEAGFIPVKCWIDNERLFSLHWLEGPG
jgi:dimethylhistidine N-methyltransferase